MAIEYRKDRKKWGYRETLRDGKRKWHFRWDTQREAEEAYEDYQKRAGLPKTALCKAAEAYLAHSLARRSRSRYEGIRYNLQKFVIPYFGESSEIGDIAPESIEAFVDLHIKRVRTTTVWHYVKDIRALFNWCIRKKLLQKNPVNQADLSLIGKRKTPKPPLDLAAIERGLACLKGREKLYALVLALLGLRRDEGNRVQANDFTDLGSEGLWLTVKGTKTAGSARTLPVPPVLNESLRHELSVSEPTAYVLCPKGRYMYDRRKMFKRVSQAAGTHVTPKTLRDYFASTTSDPVVASQMLGHTNLQTTAIYVRQTQRRMLESVQRLPFLAANSGCQLNFYGVRRFDISSTTCYEVRRQYRP
jgi:integrase